MKIYYRIILFCFLTQPSFCLEKTVFSISVCTTSSKEEANRCKENIQKTSTLEAFIQENPNKTYSTYLGNFTTYNEAKNVLNNSPNFIKKQKPFVKKIENEGKEEIKEKNNTQQKIDSLIDKIDKKIKEVQELSEKLEKENDEKIRVLEQLQKIEKEKIFAEEQRKSEESKRINAEIETQRIKDENVKILAEIETQKIKDENIKILAENQKIKETQIQAKVNIPRNSNFLSYLEEMEKLNGVATSSIKPNPITTLDNTDSFENLIIKVDSTRNIMFLKGKNRDGKIIDIKSYIVSTAKNSVKKPQGAGSITSISLNPQWIPTSKTLKAFKERGIDLPAVVPFGDKLNYMGSAKINLSHKVDGRDVYRIHGTLSEDTIGTNESSGCIRMKNKEVVELASFLDKFSKTKSLNNISVVLE